MAVGGVEQKKSQNVWGAEKGKQGGVADRYPCASPHVSQDRRRNLRQKKKESKKGKSPPRQESAVVTRKRSRLSEKKRLSPSSPRTLCAKNLKTIHTGRERT